MRSDKSPPTLESYLALLQSYEAKKKYDPVSRPLFETKAKVFSPGITSRPSRRYYLFSTRVPKIVSLRMASVCGDMRSPHNDGRTSENVYREPTMKWKKSDGCFKVTS